MATTGWQAHTLRAALSGLRKIGLTITHHRKGDQTIYAIVTGAAVGARSEPSEIRDQPTATASTEEH